jgi:hypothetical protein
VLSPILYLTLFGLFETAVLVRFQDRVLLASPLAWLYIGTLVANCLFAFAATIEVYRQWPLPDASGSRRAALVPVFVVAFIALVGFLGLYGLLAVEGMPALNGGVFPERMSMFSLRAFGAFYLALALAVIPLLWAPSVSSMLTHGFAAYGLIIFITFAALVFIQTFDFVRRPGQLAYIGIYLLVGAIVAVYLVRYGAGKSSK